MTTKIPTESRTPRRHPEAWEVARAIYRVLMLVLVIVAQWLIFIPLFVLSGNPVLVFWGLIIVSALGLAALAIVRMS